MEPFSKSTLWRAEGTCSLCLPCDLKNRCTSLIKSPTKSESHQKHKSSTLVLHETPCTSCQSAIFSSALSETIAQAKTHQNMHVIRSPHFLNIDNDFPHENKYKIEQVNDLIQKQNLQNNISIAQVPLPWCTSCHSWSYYSLFINQKITEESLFVPFPIGPLSPEKFSTFSNSQEIQPVFFLVWTSSPWSLPLSCGLALGKNLSYELLHTSLGIFIVLSQTVKHVTKLFSDRHVSILETRKSLLCEEIVELVSEIPSLFSDSRIPIIISDEISVELGTGVVHLVPGCSSADFSLFSRNNLEVTCEVDKNGNFSVKNQAEHVTLSVHGKSNAYIHETLKNKLPIYFSENFTHKVPHCQNCGTKLITRIGKHLILEFPEMPTESKQETKENNGKLHTKKNQGKSEAKEILGKHNEKNTEKKFAEEKLSPVGNFLSAVISSLDKLNYLPSTSHKKTLAATLAASCVTIFWNSKFRFAGPISSAGPLSSDQVSSRLGWPVGIVCDDDPSVVFVHPFFDCCISGIPSGISAEVYRDSQHVILENSDYSAGAGIATRLLYLAIYLHCNKQISAPVRDKKKHGIPQVTVLPEHVTVMFYSSRPIPGTLNSQCVRTSEEIRLFALENYSKSETNYSEKSHKILTSFTSSLNRLNSLCAKFLEFPDFFSADLEFQSDPEFLVLDSTRPICPLDQFILSEIHKEKTKILRAADSLDFPTVLNLLCNFFSQCSLFYFPAKYSILSGKFLTKENLRKNSRSTISVLNILRNTCEILLQKTGIRTAKNHVSEIPPTEDFLSANQKKKWSSLEKVKEFVVKHVKNGIPGVGEVVKFPDSMEFPGKLRIKVSLEWDTSQDGFNVKSLLEEDIVPFYVPLTDNGGIPEIPTEIREIPCGSNGIPIDEISSGGKIPADGILSSRESLCNTILSHYFGVETTLVFVCGEADLLKRKPQNNTLEISRFCKNVKQACCVSFYS